MPVVNLTDFIVVILSGYSFHPTQNYHLHYKVVHFKCTTSRKYETQCLRSDQHSWCCISYFVLCRNRFGLPRRIWQTKLPSSVLQWTFLKLVFWENSFLFIFHVEVFLVKSRLCHQNWKIKFEEILSEVNLEFEISNSVLLFKNCAHFASMMSLFKSVYWKWII